MTLRGMFFCEDADGVSTTATLIITLKETNDFAPELHPLSGSVCKDARRKNSGLLLTATDEDQSPHAAPFAFEMIEDLSVNWTVIQKNGKKSLLLLLLKVEDGAIYGNVLF